MREETIAEKVHKLSVWNKEFKSTQPIASDSLVLYKYSIEFYSAEFYQYLVFTSQSAKPAVVDFVNRSTDMPLVGPNGSFYRIFYPFNDAPYKLTEEVQSTQPGTLRILKQLPW